MKQNPFPPMSHALETFIQQHREKVTGILHSFDRGRFQGSLRYLYSGEIFRQYLFELKVLWKDFKDFACDVTARVHQSALDLAKAAKRPYHYVRSSQVSKEEIIRHIAAQD